MSLKAFHIFFVVVSTILAVGFGIWGIRGYSTRGDASALVAGVGSLVVAAILIGYGRWFLHKLKGVSKL